MRSLEPKSKSSGKRANGQRCFNSLQARLRHQGPLGYFLFFVIFFDKPEHSLNVRSVVTSDKIGWTYISYGHHLPNFSSSFTIRNNIIHFLVTKILDDGNKARSTNLDQIRATRLEKKKQDRLTVSFHKISMNTNIIIRFKLSYYCKNTLVHGNKAKPICTAIRPSLKILNFYLHCNKATFENFKFLFAPQ